MCGASEELCNHDVLNTMLAQETLQRLWSKVIGTKASPHGQPATDDILKRACSKREVRWMTSGEVVCSVPASTSVPAVEASVREQAGVPKNEQRLFLDGKELDVNTALPVESSSPLMLVRTTSDPRVTDLSHFHAPDKFDPVPVGGFTMVRKVSNGINGDIFRYRCRWDHLKDIPGNLGTSQTSAMADVAVKKLRKEIIRHTRNKETNERAAHLEPWKNAPPEEDALTEIGVLSYLSKRADTPKYLIRMLGCFSDSNFIWLVTEFADGGELFDIVATSRLGEDKKKQYSWELLQAVEYLHRHQISHRDVSLENALVRHGSVKLMDFGLAVRSHTASGTTLRYFRAAGKNFYRAPECYVPLVPEINVTAPISAKPGEIAMLKGNDGYLCEVRLPQDVVAGKACKAEVWGYAAQPIDIFATGMAILILCCGFPIWQKALLADPTFAYVHKLGDEGLSSILRRWQKPLPTASAMDLVTTMLRTDSPTRRPTAADCLSSPWFESLSLQK